MSSAQKDEMRLAASATVDDLPDLGSFGTVVNSIQGLQQRLESLSAAEISAAHDQAQTLMLRLADLQQKLATFLNLRELLTAVPGLIEKEIADCTVDSQSEKSAESQIAPQPSNLIQFPLLNTASKATVIRTAHEVLQPFATCSRVDDNCSPQNTTEGPTQTAELELIDRISPATSDSQNIVQGETATRNAAEQRADEAVPSLDFPTEGHSEFVTSTKSNPWTAQEIVHAGDNFHAVQQSGAAGTDTIPPTTDPARNPHGEEAKGACDSISTIEFDQRLLDDLIKNYGEFALPQGSSAESAVADSPVVTVEKTHVATANSALEVQPETKNLPNVKNNGDLDRELKKLIKDYGEYDLYSRQSPISLRTGVLAAFLLLVLIFSGLYYFSPGMLGSQNTAAVVAPHTNSYTGSTKDNLPKRNGAPDPDPAAAHLTEGRSRLKNR